MLKETRSVLSALEEIENGCLVIAKEDLPTVIQANCPGSKVKPSDPWARSLEGLSTTVWMPPRSGTTSSTRHALPRSSSGLTTRTHRIRPTNTTDIHSH